MSQPEKPKPEKTGAEQQQPLPPIHQVVADMIDDAVRERPIKEAESRANYERAGRKEPK